MCHRWPVIINLLKKNSAEGRENGVHAHNMLFLPLLRQSSKEDEEKADVKKKLIASLTARHIFESSHQADEMMLSISATICNSLTLLAFLTHPPTSLSLFVSQLACSPFVISFFHSFFCLFTSFYLSDCLF